MNNLIFLCAQTTPMLCHVVKTESTKKTQIKAYDLSKIRNIVKDIREDAQPKIAQAK